MEDDARIPDHTPVLDTDLVVGLVDIPHLSNTLVQRFLSSMKTCELVRHFLRKAQLLTGRRQRQSALSSACST